MIKFNDQLERKLQVRMDSWLLKLLSRGMKTKTKNKDKPTKNHKNITVKWIIKKMKAMGNITPTMDHYPRNE